MAVNEVESAQAEAEVDNAMILLIGCTALLTTCVISNALQKRKLYSISHSAVAIMVGMLGMILILPFSPRIQKDLAFSPTVFELLLLPPIMFEGGFSIDRKAFVANIGSILSYAFIGTVISCISMGFIMYGFAQIGFTHNLTLSSCMLFGAILSPTDPVAVISVFQTTTVNRHLYALIFGESVLNDAVAIIMLEEFRRFAHPDYPANLENISWSVAKFCGVFIGSVILAFAVTLLLCLLLKATELWRNSRGVYTEVLMFVMIPYMGYILALATGLLSPIATVLFTGFFCGHYAVKNMSSNAKELITPLGEFAAFLADTVIFNYIGMAAFSFQISGQIPWHSFTGIVAGLIACTLSRALNIVPISFVLNFFRNRKKGRPTSTSMMQALVAEDIPDSKKEEGAGVQLIDGKFQVVMWLSGLRGAVALALAVKLDADELFGRAIGKTDIPVSDGRFILNTVIWVAVFTTLILGGSIRFVLQRLKIPPSNLDAEVSANHQTIFAQIDKTCIQPWLLCAELQDMHTSGCEARILDSSYPTSPTADYVEMQTMDDGL